MMNMRRRRRNLFSATLFSALVAAAGYGTAASAQEGDSESDSNGQVEEVLVTGSYIRHSIDSPSPVEVVGRQDLLNVPRSNIGEFFVTTTINSGSFVVNDSISQALSSASNVDLRGLGPESTLVLLNGRRQVNHAIQNRQGNVFVDINALTPAILIERIEILKDGAAALYGTDAVAGVVNFITRNAFEGMEASFDYKGTEAGGQGDFNLSGIWGGGNDRAHVVMAIEYQSRDPFRLEDRFQDRLIQFGLQSPFGLPGAFKPTGGPLRPPFLRDPLCGDPRLAEIIGNPGAPGKPAPPGGPPGTCLNNNALARGLIAAENRINGMAVATYNVTEKVKVTAEMGFTRTRTRRIGGTFPVLSRPVVPANNPGNIFGFDVVMAFGRVLPNGVEEELRVDSDTWRGALSIDGPVGTTGWNWSVSAVYARNDANTDRRDVVKSRIVNALKGLGGNSCNPATGTPGVAPCFFFNPFANSTLASPGDPQFNDPEVINFILANDTSQNDSHLSTVDVLLSGNLFELPAGPLGVAIGAEYREEAMRIDFNPLANAGEFSFISQSFDMNASRNIGAVFFELVAPLLPNVELQFATRYEDFGSGVNTIDPKVGLLWKPLENLSMRASYGTSFRAPGLFQTSSRQTAAQQTPGINSVTGRPETFTPIAFIQGDPDLKPEDSRAFNIGASWEATPALSFDADFWYFDFSNIVIQENAQALVGADLGPVFQTNGPRIFRDAAGRVNRLELNFINAASLKTSGLDFGAKWRIDANAWGTITFNGKVTWVAKYRLRNAPGAPRIDGVGQRNANNFGAPLPEWRANFIANWTKGGHNALISTRYISGVQDELNAASQNRNYTSVDFLYNFTWEGGWLGRSTTFSFGVNNVFDAAPPILASDFFTVEPRLYDPRGRTYFVGFDQAF